MTQKRWIFFCYIKYALVTQWAIADDVCYIIEIKDIVGIEIGFQSVVRNVGGVLQVN